MSNATPNPVKELGHLVCGRFNIESARTKLLFEKKFQTMLLQAMQSSATVFEFSYINVSYSQTPEEKEKNIPPCLNAYVQEKPKIGEMSRVSNDIREATPDDPFAQYFVSRVIMPAAKQVFGEGVAFTIGSKTP